MRDRCTCGSCAACLIFAELQEAEARARQAEESLNASRRGHDATKAELANLRAQNARDEARDSARWRAKAEATRAELEVLREASRAMLAEKDALHAELAAELRAIDPYDSADARAELDAIAEQLEASAKRGFAAPVHAGAAEVLRSARGAFDSGGRDAHPASNAHGSSAGAGDAQRSTEAKRPSEWIRCEKHQTHSRDGACLYCNAERAAAERLSRHPSAAPDGPCPCCGSESWTFDRSALRPWRCRGCDYVRGEDIAEARRARGLSAERPSCPECGSTSHARCVRPKTPFGPGPFPSTEIPRNSVERPSDPAKCVICGGSPCWSSNCPGKSFGERPSVVCSECKGAGCPRCWSRGILPAERPSPADGQRLIDLLRESAAAGRGDLMGFAEKIVGSLRPKEREILDRWRAQRDAAPTAAQSSSIVSRLPHGLPVGAMRGEKAMKATGSGDGSGMVLRRGLKAPGSGESQVDARSQELTGARVPKVCSEQPSSPDGSAHQLASENGTGVQGFKVGDRVRLKSSAGNAGVPRDVTGVIVSRSLNLPAEGSAEYSGLWRVRLDVGSGVTVERATSELEPVGTEGPPPVGINQPDARTTYHIGHAVERELRDIARPRQDDPREHEAIDRLAEFEGTEEDLLLAIMILELGGRRAMAMQLRGMLPKRAEDPAEDAALSTVYEHAVAAKRAGGAGGAWGNASREGLHPRSTEDVRPATVDRDFRDLPGRKGDKGAPRAQTPGVDVSGVAPRNVRITPTELKAAETYRATCSKCEGVMTREGFPPEPACCEHCGEEIEKPGWVPWSKGVAAELREKFERQALEERRQRARASDVERFDKLDRLAERVKEELLDGGRHVAEAMYALGRAAAVADQLGEPAFARWLRQASEMLHAGKEHADRVTIVLGFPNTLDESVGLEWWVTTPWEERVPAKLVRRHGPLVCLAVEGIVEPSWWNMGTGEPLDQSETGPRAGWTLHCVGGVR